MAEKVADGKAMMPKHIEELERTHTNIDVIETTQESPYGEVNFMGTYVAVTLACCASFAGFIMSVTSLQLIERDLGVSPNAIWIALGWILLSAVSFILLGRLSDIFGRRWFFTGCTVSALIGSIIGATAQQTEVSIAASVFLGLGSAGQLSSNYSLGELVPMRHRFAVNGFIFLATLPFSGLGPYLARLMIINTSAGWRGIYYYDHRPERCFYVLLGPLLPYPPTFDNLHRNRTIGDELRELDVGGIFLYVAGFFLFLLGLAWGGTVHPWSSAYVIAPIVIGFFVLVAFVLYGTLMNLRRPLIPMHLFRNLDFVIVNILSAVGGVVYYSANTVFPIMVASLYTTDPIEGGLVASCVGADPSIAVFPIMVASLYTTDPIEGGLVASCVGAGVCAGQFIGSWIAVPGGQMRLKLVFSAVGLCAFVAGLAGATDSKAAGSALAVCGGLMVGLLEVIVSTVVTIVIDDQSEIGAAAGVFGSIRAAAGVLATAIYSSVLMNKLTEYTASDVVPAVVAAGLPVTSLEAFLTALSTGNTAALQEIPGVSPAAIGAGAAALRGAYAKAFKIVWLATLASGLLAVIASQLRSSPRISMTGSRMMLFDDLVPNKRLQMWRRD